MYGEHARINNDFNGGPECAAQVPLTFVLGTIAILTPVYYVTINAGLTKLLAGYAKKEEDLRLTNRSDPTGLEKAMGLMCIMCTLANIAFKWETMTLIFMLNPCHIVCVSSVYARISPPCLHPGRSYSDCLQQVRRAS